MDKPALPPEVLGVWDLLSVELKQEWDRFLALRSIISELKGR